MLKEAAAAAGRLRTPEVAGEGLIAGRAPAAEAAVARARARRAAQVGSMPVPVAAATGRLTMRQRTGAEAGAPRPIAPQTLAGTEPPAATAT